MMPQEVNLFYNAALGEMRTRQLAPIDDQNMPDELVIALSEFEHSADKTVDDMPSAVDALNDFRIFLNGYKPSTLYEVTSLSVSLNVPTKNGASVTFTMQANPTDVSIEA